MALLSYQTYGSYTGALPTFGAASTSDTIAPNERGFLWYKSTQGTTEVITVVVPGTTFGQNNPDIAVTIAATTGEEVIGPLIVRAGRPDHRAHHDHDGGRHQHHRRRGHAARRPPCPSVSTTPTSPHRTTRPKSRTKPRPPFSAESGWLPAPEPEAVDAAHAPEPTTYAPVEAEKPAAKRASKSSKSTDD